ncbi:hypothetical protein HD806DRAFT_539693 [Xylariaceae sp. AK1471]|nr:hypothetical protein HD806DRAFT_539693 [Xylariaceae sp. AK1471]
MILLSIGGNQGAVNRFVGVDIADLTGGILNSTSFLEGSNFVCFALNVLKTIVPNSLLTAFRLLGALLKLTNDVLLDPLFDLSYFAFADLTLRGESADGFDRYPKDKKIGMAL